MKYRRTIRITIDLPMEFPVSWDNDMIEWHLNEGCYCCDNLIDELSDYSEEHGCICQITKCKVLDDILTADELRKAVAKLSDSPKEDLMRYSNVIREMAELEDVIGNAIKELSRKA